MFKTLSFIFYFFSMPYQSPSVHITVSLLLLIFQNKLKNPTSFFLTSHHCFFFCGKNVKIRITYNILTDPKLLVSRFCLRTSMLRHNVKNHHPRFLSNFTYRLILYLVHDPSIFENSNLLHLHVLTIYGDDFMTTLIYMKIM